MAVLAAAGAPALAGAHGAKGEVRLPMISPAPAFRLISTDGRSVGLADLRSKVVVVTFLYATCADTCPLLTAKLVGIQRGLDQADARRIRFVAITVDPDRDTPEVLRRYAAGYGATSPAWTFLTGAPDEIRALVRRYGVYARKQAGGDVDHTFLTSVIDQSGMLRVQYLGVRFDPVEFSRDLRSALREAADVPGGSPP
jgi:protein SCO1/2